MARKSSLLLASAIAIAFVLPASASAAALTTSGGTLVQTGALMELSSTNVTSQTSFGNLTCASVVISGEVVENNGASFEGIGSGQGETSNCKLGKKAIQWTDLTLASLKATSAGEGTLSMTYVWDLPELTCHFAATNIPFTYSSGGSTITITNGKTEASPEACAALIDATFTLQQTSGGAIILD